MPNYRRAVVPGGTFFFTVVARHRRKILCNPDIRIALRDAIRTVQTKHAFRIDAWVLLPDHLHCIWTLPSGDHDFSGRWANIKLLVTKNCGYRYLDGPSQTKSERTRHEGAIWQRRFWEHAISDQEDFNRCLDYLHWNPVKHGHVSRITDWTYSSFHRYVREEIYPRDWGGVKENAADTAVFGE